MKRLFPLLSAALCTLLLTTSCRQDETPDTLSGTYRGKMEVELNIPYAEIDEWTITGQQAIVTKVDESYVDITLNLNLAEHLGVSFPGQDLNFGMLTARCLVGATIDGDTPLSGRATVAGQSIVIYGEYDERVLDITIPLGIVTVDFEGVK